MTRREFGIALKAVRVSRGLSLRRAADQVGMSFSTLDRIERAQRVPGVQTFLRVTQWAGLTSFLAEIEP